MASKEIYRAVAGIGQIIFVFVFFFNFFFLFQLRLWLVIENDLKW